ncbi:MAG: hypothetical protein ACTSRA_07910 [Promethearchaeota archaeon]
MTNYYGCINPECQLNKPFSFSSGPLLYRKRFSIEVWERIVRFQFGLHSRGSVDGPTWLFTRRRWGLASCRTLGTS